MSLNRLATSPSDGGAAHLTAAAAHLAEGRPCEAFHEADKAVALDPDVASAWALIGASLAALGEKAPAALALERSLELEPGQAHVFATLGRLYDDLDLPLIAEDRLLSAVAADPADASSHVHLSALYGRANQFALARDHALRALAIHPDLADAHRNLAAILVKMGHDDEARLHRELAYRGRSLFREGPLQPLRTVLILADAGWGNSPDRYLLPADRYLRIVWFVEYADEPDLMAPPEHDLAFNAIGDPDAMGPTARNVRRLLGHSTRPTLNAPDAIARTARDRAAELFAGLAGVEIPRTVRIDSNTFAELGTAEALRRSGMFAPLLLRPIGSHGGEGLALIDDFGAAPAVVAGRDHYATRFRDFRSADGFYRKYRIFFVDREPYPYHLAIGEHWLVHYQTSGTPDHPERLAEELKFLEDPEAALGPVSMQAVRSIGRRLDLDFCGVDFSLLPDGRVLLFEANATMLVHPESPAGPLAYKNVFVDRILEAFRSLIESGGKS